jgi:acyl-CoA synthetase (AMP-forming)/AMP-acid ligase II
MDMAESSGLTYIADGQLIVTGRTKDIIIRAGQHIYPRRWRRWSCRIPRAASPPSIDGSPLGTERLVVVAETREQGGGQLAGLGQAVAERSAIS